METSTVYTGSAQPSAVYVESLDLETYSSPMLPFRWICIYENTETSEIASEHLTLESALACSPAKPGSEISCNGRVLAHAYLAGFWELTPAGKEWKDFPEEARPKLVDGNWRYVDRR